MNFTYENQGVNTYLVYNVEKDDVIDSMSLGMLTNNRIQGLAHTVFTQMDSTVFIKYDVSAKVSVRQFFDVPVNKRKLFSVFNGIIDAMLYSEDYMIDSNTILLDLDYIFADVSNCETVLICLPIVSDDLKKKDMGAFFRNIMITTQFDQTENCDYVARIINYLNSSPVFSIYDFKRFLDSISGMVVPVIMQPQFTQQTPAQQFAPPYAPAQQTLNTAMQQGQKQYDTPVQQGQNQYYAPGPQVQSQQNLMGQHSHQQHVQMPPVQQPPVQQNQQEKKSSRFSLFRSRSKENAEPNKEQNVAPKSGQNQPVAIPGNQAVPMASMQNKPQQAQTGGTAKGQHTSAQQAFAIPGQNVSPNYGFAVPVQQAAYPHAPNPQQGYQPPMQPMQQPQRSMQQPVQQPAQQVRQQPVYNPTPMPQGQSMNFGETTVLGGGGIGETTVLGATPVAQADPHLLRIKNNEKIKLNKPVFRIGKEKSYVDYFIGDNSAISRSHANVITREGQYFVVDTNSTNHTYVNGMMIQSNVEMQISHGVKIRLGNEEFEFRLY